MMKKLVMIATVPVLVATAATAYAGTIPDTEDVVKIEAETLSHEQEGNVYRATGDVNIRTRGYTLLSDMAVLEGNANVATAAGNVVLSREGGEVRGEIAVLDLNTRKGTVRRASLFVKEGNFHISGDAIEKTGEADYRIKRGFFTTCDGAKPSWKFSATDVDVSLEEFATGRDAVFYVSDIPVFYLPYVVFPVKRERQSGLLMPRIGSSSKKGFYFNAAWYQVFSESQDLTADVDLQTRRGVGVGLDYRYIRTVNSSGEARGYLIYDRTVDKWRGNFIQSHQEILSSTSYLKSSINVVSDSDFYKDYAEDHTDYTRKALDSTIFFTKNWTHYSLTPQVRYAQILKWDVAEQTTFQKAPVVTLTGVRHRLSDTPLFLSLSSDFTNFLSENGADSPARNDGAGNKGIGYDGFRSRVKPQLTYVFHPLPFLDGKVWGAYESRFYTLYGDQSATRYEDTLSGGGGISATLYRSYDAAIGKISKIRHVAVPSVDYIASEGGDKKELFDFDYYDRPVREDRIIYSLANYFRGSWMAEDGTSRTRDLLYVKLSQSYGFSGKRRDLTTPADRFGNLSDFRIETAIYPTESLRILSDVRLDTERGRFSTANVGIDYTDTSGNKAGFSYRHTAVYLHNIPDIRNAELVKDREPQPFVDYIEGKLTLAELKPFYFDFRARYSIDSLHRRELEFDKQDRKPSRGGLLESFYSVEYRHQCWSIAFTYRDKRDDQEFLVTFTLAGIGSLGKVRAF